jgi:hypothetical protein
VPASFRTLRAVAVCVVVLLAATAIALAVALHSGRQRVRLAEAVVGQLQNAAPQHYQSAQDLIAERRFEAALTQIGYALALRPRDAEYHALQGNICQSLLRLQAAASAYDRAIALRPGYAAAQESLALCQRILATRRGAASAESLYALHRTMLEQKRLPEALHMAQRLDDDRPLLHRTWSAVLAEAGMAGRLDLNEDGSFNLDLSGFEAPDLAILESMPLRQLKLARSGIVSLAPLKGIPLRELDIAGTQVRDIAPLSGMPLEKLDLSNTEVTNLLPLSGMPLKELVISHTQVSDLAGLRGLPLQVLRLAGTRVRNLQQLTGSPLRILDLSMTRVTELNALQHLPIEQLNLDGTSISDLRPLGGAPLQTLMLSRTKVASLEPLRGLPLRELTLAGCEALETVEPLTACDDLERLVIPKHLQKVSYLQNLPSLRFLSFEKEGADAMYEETAQQFWQAQSKAQEKSLVGQPAKSKR